MPLGDKEVSSSGGEARFVPEARVGQDRLWGPRPLTDGREALTFHKTGASAVMTPLGAFPAQQGHIQNHSILFTSPLCTHSVLPPNN